MFIGNSYFPGLTEGNDNNNNLYSAYLHIRSHLFIGNLYFRWLTEGPTSIIGNLYFRGLREGPTSIIGNLYFRGLTEVPTWFNITRAWATCEVRYLI